MADEDTKAANKALDLVRLAGSSEANEASNAAMKACKLIREHKLTILPMRTVETLTRNALDTLSRPPPSRPVKPSQEGYLRTVTVGTENGRVCADCGRQIRRGDRVWTRDGIRMVHATSCDTDKL